MAVKQFSPIELSTIATGILTENIKILGYDVNIWALFFHMHKTSKQVLLVAKETKQETFAHPLAEELDRIFDRILSGEEKIPGIDLSEASRTEIMFYIRKHIDPVIKHREFNPPVLLLTIIKRLYDEEFKPAEALLGTTIVKDFVEDLYGRCSNGGYLDEVRRDCERLIELMLKSETQSMKVIKLWRTYTAEFKELLETSYSSLSHGMDHIKKVYDTAIYLNNKYNIGADIEEILLASLFHDMFDYKDRKKHHQLAHDWIMSSMHPLITLGDKERQKRVAMAILEHRASHTGTYYSPLSELIASADRGKPNLVEVVTRAFQYQIDKYPNTTHAEKVANVKQHLIDKFSQTGYAAYTNLYIKEYNVELYTMFEQIEKIRNGKTKINIAMFKNKIKVTFK